MLPVQVQTVDLTRKVHHMTILQTGTASIPSCTSISGIPHPGEGFAFSSWMLQFSLEECMLHEFTRTSPELLQNIDKKASPDILAVSNIPRYVHGRLKTTATTLVLSNSNM